MGATSDSRRIVAITTLAIARGAAVDDSILTVYANFLAPIPCDIVEEACRHLSLKPRRDFQPALPDVGTIANLCEKLLGIPPELDPETAAEFAWAAVQRAVSSVGAYRSVQFEDAAIGEAVRMVFGSWPQACSFDFDSPGWTVRRKMFLTVVVGLFERGNITARPLMGLHHTREFEVVGAVAGVPKAAQRGTTELPLRHEEARQVLREVRRRFDEKSKSLQAAIRGGA